MQKTINKQNYAAVCDELGFRAECHFVKIGPGGAVSFSAGHPDEVKALLYYAKRAGYRISSGLRAAAARA